MMKNGRKIKGGTKMEEKRGREREGEERKGEHCGGEIGK